MNNQELRQCLLANVTKMLDWIKAEFEAADCDVECKYNTKKVYRQQFVFILSKKPEYWLFSGDGHVTVKDGKVFERASRVFEPDKDITGEFLKRDRGIDDPWVEAMQLAVSQWSSIKEKVRSHLEEMKSVKEFEV